MDQKLGDRIIGSRHTDEEEKQEEANKKKRERGKAGRVVDRESEDSFPASDPPSSTPVTGPRRDRH